MTIELSTTVNQKVSEPAPVRVLLLDDESANLHQHAIILRRNGFECLSASTYAEAAGLFPEIDIAVLDYHLGAGQFGSEIAAHLSVLRPEVPIIILSATLDHTFGGAEDLHLLGGHSSNENLLSALQSLQARRHGAPVVADAAQFFYSRICHAIGADILIQIFDAEGVWVYCNEAVANYLDRDRAWFAGHSVAVEMPNTLRDWQKVAVEVLSRHETYIECSRQGLLNITEHLNESPFWSILGFPVTLHDGSPGVVLTARALPPSRPFAA